MLTKPAVVRKDVTVNTEPQKAEHLPQRRLYARFLERADEMAHQEERGYRAHKQQAQTRLRIVAQLLPPIAAILGRERNTRDRKDEKQKRRPLPRPPVPTARLRPG